MEPVIRCHIGFGRVNVDPSRCVRWVLAHACCTFEIPISDCDLCEPYRIAVPRGPYIITNITKAQRAMGRNISDYLKPIRHYSGCFHRSSSVHDGSQPS